MSGAPLSPRERVLTAFAHREPDRVPCWCGASTRFWEKAKRALGLDDEGLRRRLGDDFRRVSAAPREPEAPLGPGATWRSPFGVERTGYEYGQPLAHPLAGADLAGLEAFPWPDPGRMEVGGVRAEARRWGGEFAVLGGEWSPYWHDAIDLVGMEELLVRMYEDPPFVERLFTRIVDYYAEVSRRIFEAAADSLDIFFIGNDFGGQTGPLVGEALFRRFLLPHLARLVALGHRYGLKVMLHCCGSFTALLPAMIEAGLDGIHAVQPSCAGMDLAALKRDFGERMLFNGCIDSHHVLIAGTPERVRAETREVIDLMKGGGGFVAGASHDWILEETPLENVLAMFDTIREYGGYGPRTGAKA